MELLKRKIEKELKELESEESESEESESESEESESEEFEESEESESKDSESEESELYEDSNYGATASKRKVPVTASVLFALRIGSVDTSSYHKTEARIRGKVGTPIKKEKAKECNLPVPTEWVLTTQSHINKMKEKLKARKVKGVTSGEAIEIFKDITPPTIPPDTLPGWVKEKSKRKEQKKRAKEGKKLS